MPCLASGCQETAMNHKSNYTGKWDHYYQYIYTRTKIKRKLEFGYDN